MHDRFLCTDPALGTTITGTVFRPRDGLPEIHLAIAAPGSLLGHSAQRRAIEASLREQMSNGRCRGFKPVFARWFESDIRNREASVVPLEGTVESTLQQPPLDGSKTALWVYLLPDDLERAVGSERGEIRHGGYRHLWHANLVDFDPDGSHGQTWRIFEAYQALLAKEGCETASNCLRTWLFVRDVDTRYAGVVQARKEYFETIGLVPRTHYVASTGIEGRGFEFGSHVRMDAYAVDGLEPGQVEHLHAPTHLNPTIDYGVTFERATRVLYGDRAHVLVSGTASIDNCGDVVHPGDIQGQMARTVENIERLLDAGGATLSDIVQMIVYLRDTGDARVAREFFDSRFPDTPRILVLAPVCRPGWLVEVECIAATDQVDNGFRPF